MAVAVREVTGEGVTAEVVAGSVSLRYDSVRFVSENFNEHKELSRDYDRWLAEYASVMSKVGDISPVPCFLTARGYSEAANQRVGADGSDSSLTVDYVYTVWRHVDVGDGGWLNLDTSDPDEGVVTLSRIDGVTPDRFWGDNGTNYAVPMAFAVVPRAVALVPSLVMEGQEQFVDVDWQDVEHDMLCAIEERWDGSYDGEGLWHFDQDVATVHEDTLCVGEGGYPEVEVTLGELDRLSPMSLCREPMEYSGKRVRVEFRPPLND